MRADREIYSALEDIAFKYERMEAMISVLQQFLSEGCAEVVGVPENAVNYSLYEIETGLHENNEKLEGIISKGEVIKEKKAV